MYNVCQLYMVSFYFSTRKHDHVMFFKSSTCVFRLEWFHSRFNRKGMLSTPALSESDAITVAHFMTLGMHTGVVPTAIWDTHIHTLWHQCKSCRAICTTSFNCSDVLTLNLSDSCMTLITYAVLYWNSFHLNHMNESERFDTFREQYAVLQSQVI